MVDYRVSAHLPPSLLTWGTVTLVGEPTRAAGERTDVHVDVVLARPLLEGAQLELWTHFVSDVERPQMEQLGDPAYVTVESEVPVETLVYPDASVHGAGSFFPYRRYAAARLLAPAESADLFTFRIENVRMQSYEEALSNFRFAIVEDDDVVGYFGDAFYEIIGGPVATLRVVVPTCVERDVPFDGYVVACDRFGNKSGEALADLAFEVRLDSPEGDLLDPKVVYEDQNRRHRLEGLTLTHDGVHYLYVSVADAGGIQGRSNPMVVRDAWPEKVYWGDLHQHTYLADGRGTPAANYAYAIHTACLDFCAVTPHQEYTFAPGMQKVPSPPQTGWEELVAATERYNGPKLVTFLGSEVGPLARVAAHMNSYYLRTNNRPELERLGWGPEDAASNRLESYQAYLDVLEDANGPYLLLPHAHACGGPGRFDLPVLPEYQNNVEVASVHGVFEPFYEAWLAHGHRVGVHGGGDNHMPSTGNANPGWHYPNTNGLTGAVAPERTREAIWDAYRDRRTYAVTGNQRIFLDFTINDTAMGQVVTDDAGACAVEIEVAGTAPLMKVELVRNGDVIRTYRPDIENERALRLVWTDACNSRRVDDSLTVGRVVLEEGEIAFVYPIHAYHQTDTFKAKGGVLAFRTNGYSGITRGALLKIEDGAPDHLSFQIHDEHLGETVLETEFEVPLDARSRRLTQSLGVADHFVRPCFTREPHHPAFTLEVDWVDLAGPEAVKLRWEDGNGPAGYYYVRVEQIDGNIAWSSPIWSELRG